MRGVTEQVGLPLARVAAHEPVKVPSPSAIGRRIRPGSSANRAHCGLCRTGRSGNRCREGSGLAGTP
jgi:hypothetical protein